MNDIGGNIMNNAYTEEVYADLITNLNEFIDRECVHGEIKTKTITIGTVIYTMHLWKFFVKNMIRVKATCEGKEINGFIKIEWLPNGLTLFENAENGTTFLRFALALNREALEKLSETNHLVVQETEIEDEMITVENVSLIETISEQMLEEMKKLETPYTEDLHLLFNNREYIFHITTEWEHDKLNLSAIINVIEDSKTLEEYIKFRWDVNSRPVQTHRMIVSEKIDVFHELFPFMTVDIIKQLFSKMRLNLSLDGKILDKEEVYNLNQTTKRAVKTLTFEQFTNGLLDLYNDYEKKLYELGDVSYERKMNRVIQILKYVTNKQKKTLG